MSGLYLCRMSFFIFDDYELQYSLCIFPCCDEEVVKVFVHTNILKEKLIFSLVTQRLEIIIINTALNVPTNFLEAAKSNR